MGWYTANVLFADQEIPTSPYKVNIEPNIDVSKIRVNGLEPSKYHTISAQLSKFQLSIKSRAIIEALNQS